MKYESLLRQQVQQHPYRLLFATVSGAHLYGFESPDSDYDLRGVHLLPLEEVVGLRTGPETLERTDQQQDVQIDLVTHDARKFFLMLLKRNGYVLEQLFSPLVVHTTPEHEELKRIAAGCITRHHVHHYLGFAATQWKLFCKEQPPRIKPLLYVYRVLLTGIHLMRTGQVVAHLPTLNQQARLPFLEELIAIKRQGSEKAELAEGDVEFHRRQKEQLEEQLRREAERSSLPEQPTAGEQLHEFLLRLRLGRG